MSTETKTTLGLHALKTARKVSASARVKATNDFSKARRLILQCSQRGLVAVDFLISLETYQDPMALEMFRDMCEKEGILAICVPECRGPQVMELDWEKPNEKELDGQEAK